MPPVAAPPDGINRVHFEGARNLYANMPRAQYDTPATIAKRQGFNQTGKAIQLAVNAYPITAFPTKTVQQYDVSSSPLMLQGSRLTLHRCSSEMALRNVP